MNAIIFIAITSASCPPCAALHRDYGDDARIQWQDATPEAREQYRVRGVPTVIAMRDGQEIGRHVGYQGKREMERWMRSMEDRAAREQTPPPRLHATGGRP